MENLTESAQKVVKRRIDKLTEIENLSMLLRKLEERQSVVSLQVGTLYDWETLGIQADIERALRIGIKQVLQGKAQYI